MKEKYYGDLLKVVKRFPEALKYIKNQTEDEYLEAARQNRDVIQCIKDPDMRSKIAEKLKKESEVIEQ